MKKGTKIKRYGGGNLYGRSSRGPLLMLLAVVLVLGVLGVIGWSLYPPLHELIMSIGQQEPPALPPPSDASQAGETGSSEASPNESVMPATPSAGRDFSGLYVPAAVAGDFAALDSLLASAKEAGLTTVMVDAKDASGRVLYRSENENALSARALSENAYDAAAVAKRIIDAGLRPVARIHAFRDNHMARTLGQPMAVRYYDTATIWLDNAPNQGGNGWLNPYSTDARGYITALAVELTELGFADIVVDSVQFPTGVALEKAGYGQTGGVSRAEALRSFAAELTQAVEAAGGGAMVYYPAAAIASENELVYGGNAATLGAGRMMLGILPESLPRGLVLGETTLDNPAADFSATVTAALNHAKTLAPDNSWVAMVQAYGADGAPLPAAELGRQAEAARAAGAGVLYYNPQGGYSLDAQLLASRAAVAP